MAQAAEAHTKLSQIAYQRFKEALFSRQIPIGATVSQGDAAYLAADACNLLITIGGTGVGRSDAAITARDIPILTFPHFHIFTFLKGSPRSS